MRKLYFYIFSCFLIISFNYYSQTATHPLVNSNVIIENNPVSNAFYANIQTGSDYFSPGACCGNQGGSSEKYVVTIESKNLTLTSTIINELKNSTSEYSDGIDNNGNPVINIAPNLLSFNGGLVVGEEVNVYMVYLNDREDRRSYNNGSGPYGEIEFEGEILSVGMDWQHTLWFSGITNTNLGTSDYPKWSWAYDDNREGKFEDRKFEPNSYSSGIFQNAWDNTSNSIDWFQLVDINEIKKIL